VIDAKELQEIRARQARFAERDEVLAMHARDGLLGDGFDLALHASAMPAVESARDVPRLADEVERLRPAAYATGPQDCCEGDCPDEEPSPDGQWCSHVTEQVATLDDVIRADCYQKLAEALEGAAQRATRGEPADPTGNGRSLAQLVLDAVEDTRQHIEQWTTTGEVP
jgi:hypothetical protein